MRTYCHWCKIRQYYFPNSLAPLFFVTTYILSDVYHILWFSSIMASMVKADVLLSVYVVSFLIGFPANLVAVYVFSKKIHSKPRSIDILLLNLTVSDLLFLIILPFKMHEAASGMTWTLPKFICSISSFLFFFTIYTSILTLMAVSVVRYTAVAFPITYKRLQKPVYAISTCAVIWLIAGAHCSIILISLYHPSLSNKNFTVCYRDFTEKQLAFLLPARFEVFFVLSFIPLLICIFCYLNCILILYRRPGISHKQKQKAIGMAMGTLAVFLICVIPFNISHLIGFFQGKNPDWRHYTLLLSTFNTCIDPIIFYFSSSSFRCTGKKSVFRKH
ncbi:free fatty acid receptor 3-like [Mugil cephalus]|uniref:free fatty acid receptor 3-like n=1 Tax=Mugil cephalus TaxID=48193 RepID=UPI001FB63176|nr:free fatty acid receptor 3-like [Mugil cephalus]